MVAESSSHDRENLISRLADSLTEVILDALQGRDRVVLVDFPLHKNAGDSAIWLGERRWFSDHGVEVVAISSRSTYNPRLIRRVLDSRTAIAIHGGGNFGDVWPQFQAQKERVADDFADHKLIQLPQTVYYSNARSALGSTNGPLGRHRDFTILCRDTRSVEQIGKFLPRAKATLATDMAFALGPQSGVPPAADILWLARTDHEGTVEPPESSSGVLVTDWSLAGRERLWDAVAWLPLTSRFIKPLARTHALVGRAVQPLLDPLARLNVGCALELLSSGRVVVTDRLHAHILGLLLGRPQVLLDNSYGKLSAFRESWTYDAIDVQTASNPEEALSKARELVGAAG
jgi:exopolysaccharide biosynthesis predicted pyruvyltransferase EpsI